MIILLSPAKSLDYETPAPSNLLGTQPIFSNQAYQLIQNLKEKSPEQIATLMDISVQLSTLNSTRYRSWQSQATPDNAKQAVLAFNGDVYSGLDAKTLTPEELLWAQNHVVILSGLYGVLRPLDLLQPYRLEMGTPLITDKGNNLYQFWGTSITDYLNDQLSKESSPLLINLASNEYFKSVHKKIIKTNIIECVFEDMKNGKYKVISFLAKKARGMMARHIIKNQINNPEDIKKFTTADYIYDSSASEPHRFVFRRG